MSTPTLNAPPQAEQGAPESGEPVDSAPGSRASDLGATGRIAAVRTTLAAGTRRTRRMMAAVLLWFVDRLLGPVRARAGEAGMTTAEYAVGTIAACGFAAILYQVVTGDSIVSALGDLISKALSSL